MGMAVEPLEPRRLLAGLAYDFDISDEQPMAGLPGGTLFVVDDDDGGQGHEVWVASGPGTERPLAGVPAFGGRTDPAFERLGRAAFFTTGDALWRSDGTAAGTGPIHRGVDVSAPAVWRGGLWFADDGDLYVSDGTPAGTRRVLDDPAPPPAPGGARPSETPEITLARVEPLGPAGLGLWFTETITREPRYFGRANDGVILTNIGGYYGPETFGRQILAGYDGAQVAAEPLAFTTFDNGGVLSVTPVPSGSLVQHRKPGPDTLSLTDGRAIAPDAGLPEPSDDLHLHQYGESLPVIGGLAYYWVRAGGDRHQLWRTDGTPGGTRNLLTADGRYDLQLIDYRGTPILIEREYDAADDSFGYNVRRVDPVTGQTADMGQLQLSPRLADGLVLQADAGAGVISYLADDGQLAPLGTMPLTSEYVGAARIGNTIFINEFNEDDAPTRRAFDAPGAPATGAAAGVLFDDRDGDGVLGRGEAAAAGGAVFADLNGDGVMGLGEPRAASDAGGNYYLRGLPAGTKVALRQAGADGFAVVAAAAGEVTLAHVGTRRHLADVRAFVFDDRNLNGVHDPGEGGLDGYRVWLDADDDGRLDPGERHARAEGGYVTFSDVPVGDHVLRQTPVGGDVVATTDLRRAFALAADGVAWQKFGNVADPRTASVGGAVYQNLRPDGTFGGPGDRPFAGVRVWLDTDRDGRLDFDEPWQRANADGRYEFAGLAAGEYQVRQTPLGGRWELPVPVRTVTVDAAERRGGLDFGNTPEPVDTIRLLPFWDGVAPPNTAPFVGEPTLPPDFYWDETVVRLYGRDGGRWRELNPDLYYVQYNEIGFFNDGSVPLADEFAVEMWIEADRSYHALTTFSFADAREYRSIPGSFYLPADLPLRAS